MKDHYVLRNMGTNQDIPLVADSLILGRKDDCEIVVDCNEASRHHARIVLGDGRPVLEDLGSTNGTVLNGRRLRQPEDLNGGDIILIGQVRYLVIAPGDTGNMTILGGRLGKVDDNYVVDQPDPNMTGIRVPFPRPPGWSDKDDFAANRAPARQPLDRLADEMARQSIAVENAAAILMIVSDRGRNSLFVLDAGKDSWTLGRSAGNDVEISDVTVSSKHAILTRNSERWEVQDRHSTNGSRVNGKTINTSSLADGDTLQLGKVELLFKAL